MEINPKLSIIIPVYGVENYIERCLKSVVSQTLKEIEIIIVNDGSKDNSMQICKKYSQIDNRIIIYDKNNEGLGLTRNYGMKRAHADYIAFLDSDDFIEEKFYEKLYKQIINTNADSCFGNIKMFYNENKIIEKDIIPFDEETIDSKKLLYNILHVNEKNNLNGYMGMSVWRSIYKKNIIEQNNIKFESERKYISEDILFNIDYLMNSNNVTFVKNTYYYYCFNDTSLTHTYREDRFEKSIVLYKEIVKRLEIYNIYNDTKAGTASLFLGYVRGAIKQEVLYSGKDKKNIKKYIKNILSNDIVQDSLKIKSYENLKKCILDVLFKLKNADLIMLLYKLNNI